MARHIVETTLSPVQLRQVIMMLAQLGYVDDDQRGNIKNLGFFGLRRTELIEIAKRFEFEIDPTHPAIELARYFETQFLQGKFEFQAETAEERLSPRQLVAEAEILNVEFKGKGHAMLSADVGEAKGMLYEQAGALGITVPDKTLAQLAEAVAKESENGDTLRTTDDETQRIGETGHLGRDRPGQGGENDATAIGGAD